MSPFSRFRGHLSRDQLDQDPHAWPFLNRYSVSSAAAPAKPIPNPDALRNAFVPDASAEGPKDVLIYPDASHIVVHLCLLECFRNLRKSTVELDIQSFKPPAYSEAPAPDGDHIEESLPESLHWDLLIRLAVVRFTTWWHNLPQVFSHATAYDHRAGSKAEMQLSVNYLPPLDVLLIWYSLMLDEEEYSRLCHQTADTRLSLLCFPWPAIRDAIDRETMTFRLTRPAEILFSTISEQSADIFQYLDQPPAYAESARSPFAIDLVSQVHLQEHFIDASHHAAWVQSPAMCGSLRRSCADYVRAHTAGRLGEYSLQQLPYGVELVWRTHMLYPAQYLNYRQNSTEIREEPNDLKAVSSSDTGSSTSSSLQSKDDLNCICWVCERIRDDVPAWRYLKETKTFDPSHLAPLSNDQIAQIRDDVCFFRATESNRRHGIPLPTRPPTMAEREAERLEAKKKKETGYLAGPNECIEERPDGRKRFRIRSSFQAAYGLNV
jgi:hypothetical protein